MRDFKLETYFAQWEFIAKFHLTASDCESMSQNELVKLASLEDQANFEELRLGYTETRGQFELRDVIASTYADLNREDILCFSGSEEGIYIAMKILLKANDHAIVFTPSYQSAETVPLSICEVSGLMLRPEVNWEPEIEELKTLIRPNTKLIYINFPNNPTGKAISLSKLLGLISLCRENGIWLFSDEVFRGVESDPAKLVPQVADLYERGFSLNGLSKAYGLPGLRIGWIAGKDHSKLEQMHRYRHYLSMCNSGPSEQLSLIALKARATILKRNVSLIRSNLALLREFFSEFTDTFEWYEPDGGCVAFPRYLGPGNVECWATTLVNDTGVLLLPSNIYESELTATPTDRFRIGFGRANFAAGLNILREALMKAREH